MGHGHGHRHRIGRGRGRERHRRALHAPLSYRHPRTGHAPCHGGLVGTPYSPSLARTIPDARLQGNLVSMGTVTDLARWIAPCVVHPFLPSTFRPPRRNILSQRRGASRRISHPPGQISDICEWMTVRLPPPTLTLLPPLPSHPPPPHTTPITQPNPTSPSLPRSPISRSQSYRTSVAWLWLLLQSETRIDINTPTSSSSSTGWSDFYIFRLLQSRSYISTTEHCTIKPFTPSQNARTQVTLTLLPSVHFHITQ